MVNVTPSGLKGEARLKWYWAYGEGRQKWINDPHPYTALLHHLEKYEGPAFAYGNAANVFKMATGHYPGQRAKGERL